MGIWDLFKKPAADAASTLISSITEGIDSLITNKEEREQLRQLAVKQVQDYNIKLIELANMVEVEYIKDTQSARVMQQSALQQEDKFSKRFVYYLSIGLIGAALAFDFTLLFANIPDDNRDMINMALGTLNSLGFASVVSFFLGSSKSSATKSDTINTLVSKQ